MPSAGEYSNADPRLVRDGRVAGRIIARLHPWEGNAMKLPRRQFLHLAAGAAALPAVSRIASAQTYPARPVRIIVGFGPGGAPDIVARLLGQWLSERLGQPFVVEIRSGAGGNIATEAVANADPDGYTLLLAGLPNAINATLYDKLNFNFIQDIAPVAGLISTVNLLLVNPSVPAKTVPELVAHAKANPGKLNMASAGNGSPPHLVGELFKMMAGVDMIHVPYRGAGAALNDLIGGYVQVLFLSMLASIEHVRAGKLRALAVTSATRSELIPDVPTVGEFVAGYEATTWWGIGVPRNTPAEIVDRLNNEINTALADPKMKMRLADQGATVLAGSQTDFGKLIAEETEKWGKVIRAGNIKLE
jgi:tripartite-type tricarboxylate transporter receptor subunit TctC